MDWGQKAAALEEAKLELLLALSVLKRGASDPYFKIDRIRFGGERFTDGYEGVIIEEMVKSKQLMRLNDIEHSRLHSNFTRLLDEPVIALTTLGITDLEHQMEVEESYVSRIAQGLQAPKYLSSPLPSNWAGRGAPAAGRIVPLDHNSSEYQLIARRLEDLRDVVSEHVHNGTNSAEDSRLVRSISAAVEFWSAAELKVIQIQIGVLLAIEDVRAFLTKVGRDVGIGLLVDLIKSYVKSKINLEI